VTAQVNLSAGKGQAVTAEINVDARKDESPSDGLGGETWWKRALIVVGFIYINGYMASRAFYGSLGLSPSDFVMGDYDYLIQGLWYLTPEYQSVLHWQLGFAGYYFCIILTWLLVWLSSKVAFKERLFRQAWLPSLLVVLLAVAISVLAAFHGQKRANVLKALTEKLPMVIIYYSPEEKESAAIAGRLVSRNDKIVCLTSINSWVVTNEERIATDETDPRFFVIPFEKVKTIIIR